MGTGVVRAGRLTSLGGVDTALVLRAQAGDDAALHELLSDVQRLVHRYVRRRLLTYHAGAQLAEDVTQETVLAVYGKLSTWRDEGKPFAALVYAIAANKTADAQRHFGRKVEDVKDFSDPDWRLKADPALSAEQTVEVRRDLAAAYEALGRLRPDDARIVLLRGEGYEVDEVAALLGVTPNVVRVRHHRAKARLRAVVYGA